jgi:hypothetical protein
LKVGDKAHGSTNILSVKNHKQKVMLTNGLRHPGNILRMVAIFKTLTAELRMRQQPCGPVMLEQFRNLHTKLQNKEEFSENCRELEVITTIMEKPYCLPILPPRVTQQPELAFAC